MPDRIRSIWPFARKHRGQPSRLAGIVGWLMFRRTAVAVLITTLLIVHSARALVQTTEEFYRENGLTFVVGAAPGGSHDVYARLLARHLGRHLPGAPRISIQNMPGAGSLRAANYVYNFAPRDGTVIGMFSRNMPVVGILGGNANVQFDPRKFTWLGSPSSFQNDANILIVRKDAPVKSIEEARRADLPPLVLGGSADGGIANDVPIILHDTIGLHVKQVIGYPDSPATFVAIERGEVHGRTIDLSALKSVKPEWLSPESGFRVLVQFARATRHPQFPEVPTARELAKNEDARALIELAEAPYSISRPVAAPPDLQADRAIALRQAFIAVQRDPQYLDDAAAVGLDVSPIGGDEVLRAIEAIATAPADFLEYARKLFAETKGGG
jgi:tripartite-type tricarboxylate transporter receptor subunit TctC